MRNKILFYSTVLFFLTSLTGCSSILGFIFGIHEPKKEKKETIIGYAVNNKIDTTEVLLFEEQALRKLYQSTYKPNYEPGLRPIQMMGFDNTGELKMHWASCEGPLKMLGTLTSYPPKNGEPFFPAITLENELQKMLTPSGKQPDIPKIKKADYVFIVYWAIFTDKQTKSLIRTVEKYAEQYPDKKIEILKVNIDKRES